MIQTNICGRKYLNIFKYPNIRHTMVCGNVCQKFTSTPKDQEENLFVLYVCTPKGMVYLEDYSEYAQMRSVIRPYCTNEMPGGQIEETAGVPLVTL